MMQQRKCARHQRQRSGGPRISRTDAGRSRVATASLVKRSNRACVWLNSSSQDGGLASASLSSASGELARWRSASRTGLVGVEELGQNEPEVLVQRLVGL